MRPLEDAKELKAIWPRWDAIAGTLPMRAWDRLKEVPFDQRPEQLPAYDQPVFSGLGHGGVLGAKRLQE
jgi:hypothetical protein